MKTPVEQAFEHLKAHIGQHREDLIEIGSLAASGLSSRVVDRADETTRHATERRLEAAKLVAKLSPQEVARVRESLGLRAEYFDHLAALHAVHLKLTDADGDVATALQVAHDLSHGRTA